jgi:nuclease S1
MPARRSCRAPRLMLVQVSTFLVISASATPAWAWGRLGHRLIAKMAERHLSPEAKAAVAELLEPGESLADASAWADENRTRVHGSGAWHYANVSIDEPRYADRVAGEGQVVPRIHEFQAILRDRTRPVSERRRALRFLVHLVEDLHQPLHVGENHDKGGNDLQVRFFRRGTNFHHLWDTLILEHRSRDEDRWLDDPVAIDKPIDRAIAMDGMVEDWATESLLAAREAYKDPATG